MSVWTILLLFVLIALIGATIVERSKPTVVKSEGSCSCLAWGSSAHPSGVRYVRDANCPVHQEG